MNIVPDVYFTWEKEESELKPWSLIKNFFEAVYYNVENQELDYFISETLANIIRINLIVDDYRKAEDEYILDFINMGYIFNLTTNEVEKIEFDTWAFCPDEVMSYIFCRIVTREEHGDELGDLLDMELPTYRTKTLKSKNPKIYLYSEPSTEKIKRLGIPIHMSKGSRKFKSRPFVWASDIFKRAKSRI